ncbi:MAG: FAD-binding oxidoreductase [Bradyrhizobium sp.]|nr:MAG: FAD-binding oxidoreductase [Bradyrhizobium sp.]
MRGDPRSHGLWERSAPPAPPTPKLEGDTDCDVAIVGAGYTGLSAALHVAQAGASVVVLDGAEIGFGGSGRNVGLVNAGMWSPPDTLAARLGDTYGPRLVTLLSEAPRAVFGLVDKFAINCELKRSGTLHCAAGPRGLAEIRERERQWRLRGAPVKLLDAGEAATLIGASAYKGALLDKRGGTIQPLAYARGLAGAAIGAGARIFAESPVTDCVEDGEWQRLRTPQGAVRAKWVIVATNAYTVAPWATLREELTLIPYFNVATAPLPEDVRKAILPERQGAWDTRLVLNSFRLDRSGRLIFGSFGALRDRDAAIHRAWARRAIGKLFPQLARIELDAEWYGMIGLTDERLPRFHRLAKNVVSISGYNGRGIAPGTVFGRALAQLATGAIGEADMPLPLTAPSPARRREKAEPFYAWGAKLAHLFGARMSRG